MSEKCKFCNRPSELTYVSFPLCDHHWEALCESIESTNRYRKRLKLEPITVTNMASKAVTECAKLKPVPPKPIEKKEPINEIEMRIAKIRTKEDMKGFKRQALKEIVKHLGLKYIKGTQKKELKIAIIGAINDRRYTQFIKEKTKKRSKQ